MGSKKAPKPPDYAAAAREQADSSERVTNQQTWANRPNQNTPFGSMSWDTAAQIDPATGQRVTQWTQNMSLDPRMQSALDDQQQLTRNRSQLALGLMGRAEDEFGQPINDWNNYQQLQGAPGVPQYNYDGLPGSEGAMATRQNSEDAIYNRMTSRLDPRFNQGAEQLEAKLRNQGMRPGDQAYDQAMQEFGRNKTDAYQTAMNESIMGGGAEYDRAYRTREQLVGEQLRTGGQQFQQGMAGAGMNNTVRQQQISEEMQRRGFSLNEINAILTGQQVGMPNMPGFNTANASQGLQSLSAANMQHGANLDSFNAEQAAWQGLMGGIGSMGSAFMPM